MVSREAKLDLDLAEKLVEAGKGAGSFETVLGKTISTNDFYEGQVKEVLKKLRTVLKLQYPLHPIFTALHFRFPVAYCAFATKFDQI